MTPSRREHTRKQPTGYLEIYDRNSRKFVGTVVDFTISGMRLYAEKPLESGTAYQWYLSLHEPIHGQNKIPLEAECRWCRECTGKLLAGSFAAGMEFTSLSSLDRELIESMLDSPWFRDWRQLPDYEALRQETGFPEE